MWWVVASSLLVEVRAEPLGAPPDPHAPPALQDQLGQAKQALQRGEPERAAELLTDLLTRLEILDEAPEELRVEALVFLGDALYTAGDKDTARAVFRRVLRVRPDHLISPYHHTEDVRAFFALVREAVESEPTAWTPEPAPPATPVPRPMPAWGYAPFGLSHLAMGRPGRGIAFGTAQAGLAAVSLASHSVLRRANRSPRDGHPFNWTEEQVVQRVPRIRNFVQWPSTLGFYATWALAAWDASAVWKRRPTELSLVVAPNEVRLGGRF